VTNDKTSVSLSLGLEELAVVLNLMGYPEIAKGTLISQLGEMSADEERGRLLAANHSLMARDILYLQGDAIRMKERYAKLLGFLITNDFALRGTMRRKDAPEEHLTLYVRKDRVAVHHITHSVVHSFQETTDVETALDTLSKLVLSANSVPFDAPQFAVNEEQMEQARTLAAEKGADETCDFLAGLNVPAAAARPFADDLSRQNFRSVVLRINIDLTEGPASDQGYLVLGGESGRAWHMDIHARNGDARLVVQPATAKLMRQSTKALFRTP